MKASMVGLLVGLLLGIAAAAGGISGFLVAVVLGAIGWVVAAQVSGERNIVEMFRGRDND